ncbi:MAG: hypothetical protein OXI78_06940 [Anaerolineaceae bacterium]|nr:hypothetical protein [Anaerolineaceae bacterium]
MAGFDFPTGDVRDAMNAAWLPVRHKSGGVTLRSGRTFGRRFVARIA